MKFYLAFFSLLILTSAQAQKTVEGVSFAASMQVGGTKLNLNGAGLREKFYFDLYVAGFYSQSKITTGDVAMTKDENMAMRIVLVSDKITREKFIAAVDEGFQKATNNNTTAIATKIADFKKCFNTEFKVNDVIIIQYIKGTGTQVLINNKIVKTIPGYDFKKALFGIWFCNDPADEDLKNGMLGK
ncbi:MAG: chalcone isomerase family protein [Flavobacteriales bacterium]